MHALLTLAEDMTPFEASSERLDEIFDVRHVLLFAWIVGNMGPAVLRQALGLVLRSLERDCDGPSLVLLAASVADAIGTISRAITRGEGRDDGTRAGRDGVSLQKHMLMTCTGKIRAPLYLS